MVDPQTMCRQHLLGEHKELHMLAGCLRLGKSLDGYLKKKIVEPLSILKRHSEIVQEMEQRKYNHQSPLDVEGLHDSLAALPFSKMAVRVNRARSKKELHQRCSRCQERNKDYEKKES